MADRPAPPWQKQPAPSKIRVIVVVNQRSGTVHGVTTDRETAQHWLREISDRHGPGSATQTADVVECAGQHFDPDLDTLFGQRDAALAEVDRMRPVVEAAQAWSAALKQIGGKASSRDRDDADRYDDALTALAEAVDAFVADAVRSRPILLSGQAMGEETRTHAP